jgi:protein ImuB
MLWLCIRFPRLPLEALTRAQTPEEKNQALAIMENHLIVQPNDVASECGITPGLSTITARLQCPDLQILQRNRERETRQMEELAQWGFSFTPMVSIKAAKHEESNHSPHLFLELDNCLKAHGGLKTLLAQLQQELIQMGVSYSMGLGHNPSAALLLSQLPEHRKWLQQTYTPPTPHEWKQWMYHVPSKLLECDNKTIKKLYVHGFTRVGQLLARTLSEVESYFGCSFINYLTLLTGSSQEHISLYQSAERFESEIFFPTPRNRPEQILIPASHLLRDLCLQSQRQQFYIQRLHWRFDFEQGKHETLPIKKSLLQLKSQCLIQSIQLQLDGVTFCHPLQSLYLVCNKLHSQDQKTLIEGQCNKTQQDKRSHQLLTKLRTRLGDQAFSSIKVRNRHSDPSR